MMCNSSSLLACEAKPGWDQTLGAKFAPKTDCPGLMPNELIHLLFRTYNGFGCVTIVIKLKSSTKRSGVYGIFVCTGV